MLLREEIILLRNVIKNKMQIIIIIKNRIKYLLGKVKPGETLRHYRIL